MSFKIRIANAFTGADLWTADYWGDGFRHHGTGVLLRDISFTLEPNPGNLELSAWSTTDQVRDEMELTGLMFEDGATYVIDFSTRKITKEEFVPPPPGSLTSKFKLWWLAVPVGLVGVILIAKRKK